LAASRSPRPSPRSSRRSCSALSDPCDRALSRLLREDRMQASGPQRRPCTFEGTAASACGAASVRATCGPTRRHERRLTRMRSTRSDASSLIAPVLGAVLTLVLVAAQLVLSPTASWATTPADEKTAEAYVSPDDLGDGAKPPAPV